VSKVLDEYYEERAKGSSELDVNKLAGPLIKRYEEAFARNPSAYEQEYLDALNWVVSSMERNTKQITRLEKPPEMAREEWIFVQSLQNLGEGMLKIVSHSILDKVKQGMHSPAGRQQALKMVGRLDRLMPSSPTSSVQRGSGVRVVASGKEVFENQCAACHLTGAAGAPKLGDRLAWQPRIGLGFNKLVKATLNGKGAMGAQGGGSFQDFEIARAVAYLANLSGANFKYPAPPPSHPGTVTVNISTINSSENNLPSTPYELMSAEQRLKSGERIYNKHCIACHQNNGMAIGPIKSMVNAPAFRQSDTAIDLLLYGTNSRDISMPIFEMLTDEEIAEVINFSRFKFRSETTIPAVKPHDVRARRR
jgi:cytochrome c5